MSLEDEVEALRHVPLFAKIERSRLKLLAFAGERLTFAAGQDLMRQGDPGDCAYVIISGAADVLVTIPAEPARERRVAGVAENDFVGEIAILCDTPRTATVRAVKETVTLKITDELFFELVTEFPHIAIGVMRVLAERLDRTTRELSALGGPPADLPPDEPRV